MSDPTHADRILTMADEFDGWPLIEIYGVGPDAKTCMCPKGATCKSAGKHPKELGWQNAEGLSPVEVAAILAKRPRANIGTLTGAPAGFWVLDIDQPGMGAMKALIEIHGELPETRVHRTGGGTYHYFFLMPDFDVTNRRGTLPVGIDARGTGGQVVLPASRSSKGHYDVVRAAEILPAPQWLLDMIRPTGIDDPEPPKPGLDDLETALAPTVDQRVADTAQAVAAMSDPADDVDAPYVQTQREAALEKSIISNEVAKLRALAAAATPNGEGYKGLPWDITTYEVACKFFELANADWAVLTHDQAEALVRANAPRDDGFDDLRVEEKIRSAAKKVGTKARENSTRDNSDWLDNFGAPSVGVTPEPAADLPKRGFNDAGNADRLVDRHGGELRWAADAEVWLTFDGRRWDDAAAGTRLKGLARKTIEEAREHESSLYSDVPDEFFANGEPKSSPLERFHDWIGKSLFETRLKAMVNVATPDERVQAMMGDFDTHPHLLNVANGVIDLRTGTLSPHDPALLLKRLAPVEFDPMAQAPMFEKFLERVHPNPDMRAYLQTIAGYSCTGETGEQAVFLHNGFGANGKSVFLEVIREVLGDMGQKIARDTIMSKNGQASGIPDDIASMLGGRLLVGSETSAGKKLDDERIKELVSGEAQHVRHLFGKWFDFKPTGKIHIATNHLPGMESGGHGMGRRLRIIPWEVTIPESEQIKGLDIQILKSEAPGVLAWLVRGAVQWYAHGLRTPEIVTARTAEHIEEADPILPFIRERLTVLDGDANGTETMAVYQSYVSWAQANGIKPMSNKTFTPAIRERLGHDIQYRAHDVGRRSMMRVRLNLQAVPMGHDKFFVG